MVIDLTMDDDDQVPVPRIVQGAPPAPPAAALGNKGPMHSRCDCPKISFAVVGTRETACDKCQCFVCEVAWTACKNWNEHCDADPRGAYANHWIKLRDTARNPKAGGADAAAAVNPNQDLVGSDSDDEAKADEEDEEDAAAMLLEGDDDDGDNDGDWGIARLPQLVLPGHNNRLGGPAGPMVAAFSMKTFTEPEYAGKKTINFMDRTVPQCIFDPLNKVKTEAGGGNALEVALCKTVYQRILAETNNYRPLGHGDYVSHRPVSMTVHVDSPKFSEIRSLPGLLRKISLDLGKNHNADTIFNATCMSKATEYGMMERPGAPIADHYKGTNVRITISPFLPLPTEMLPPEPMCVVDAGARHGRRICPVCKWGSPTNWDKVICKSCALYTHVPDRRKLAAAAPQEKPKQTHVQIGREITLNLIMKPNFLKAQQRTSRVNRRLRDPYVAADMELQQVERWREVELGANPKVSHIKAFNSTWRITSVNDFNTELHIASGIDHNEPRQLEEKYIFGFVDSAAKLNLKSSAFAVMTTVTSTPEPTQGPALAKWKKLSAVEKISRISITFRLFLNTDLHQASFPLEPTFWGAEKEIMAHFLTSSELPTLRSAVEGVFPIKEDLAVDDLLTSSKPNFGSHADLEQGVGAILKGIIRESMRIGITPPGFAADDPLNYNRLSLSQQVVSKLAPETDAEKSEKKKMTSIQSSRYHAVAQSLADVMTDLENLGHPTVDETPGGDGYALRGLRCQLRSYQKQSLRWALDQENLKGGISSHLYAELKDSNGFGTGVYYSPYSGETTKTRPADVRGGFICEEMGMGKTVITLGIILCNPAPNSTKGPAADEAWGEFSPAASALAKRRAAEEAARALYLARIGDVAAGGAAPASRAGVAPNAPAAAAAAAPGGVAAAAPAAEGAEDVEGGNELVADKVEGEDLLSDKPTHRSRGTLVICPVSLVGQWCAEARSKLRFDKSEFKIHEYHGSNRIRDPAKLSVFDLVVTTYETLASDLRMYEKNHAKDKYPAVSKINWFRIVCDESHKGKSKNAMSSSLFGLYSMRRWCVTGTPVNTNLNDFAGQFRVLGVPIMCETSWWNCMSLKDAKSRQFRRHNHLNSCRHDYQSSNFGYAAIMSILRRVVMRHTKGMAYAESKEGLLVLPPMKQMVQWIKFTEDEESMYKQLESHMLKQYKAIADMGMLTLKRNTIQLLSFVKDLQMACSGGLMPNRIADILNTKIAVRDDGDGGPNNNEECSICLELMDRPMETPCGHLYCGDCIQGIIANAALDKALCPLCRAPVKAADLKRPGGEPEPLPAVLLDQPPDLTLEERRKLAAPSKTAMLSKLTWLVGKLKALHKEDRTAKVLVFSQFNQTLEWLQSELPKRGFQFRTLRGDMSMAARKKALEEFQNDPPTTVFLLSLRAGAVGVNLTQANHVVVMEPCLNTALEDQAIGRVYRMGQTREVHVYRVACANSVEERIIMLQRIRKEAGAEAQKLAESRLLENSRVEALEDLPITTVTASSSLAGHHIGNVMFEARDTSWISAFKVRNFVEAQHLTLTLPLDKWYWREIEIMPCVGGVGSAPSMIGVSYIKAPRDNDGMGMREQELVLKEASRVQKLVSCPHSQSLPLFACFTRVSASHPSPPLPTHTPSSLYLLPSSK